MHHQQLQGIPLESNENILQQNIISSENKIPTERPFSCSKPFTLKFFSL